MTDIFVAIRGRLTGHDRLRRGSRRSGSTARGMPRRRRKDAGHGHIHRHRYTGVGDGTAGHCTGGAGHDHPKRRGHDRPFTRVFCPGKRLYCALRRLRAPTLFSVRLGRRRSERWKKPPYGRDLLSASRRGKNIINAIPGAMSLFCCRSISPLV